MNKEQGDEPQPERQGNNKPRTLEAVMLERE
jgi:hypothetical protein